MSLPPPLPGGPAAPGLVLLGTLGKLKSSVPGISGRLGISPAGADGAADATTK